MARPTDVEALRDELKTVGERGLITRGLGRSYGDPAQNAGGTVLDLTDWDTILDVDTAAPNVRVQAGISLDRLLRALLPLGLWLPVVPGTRQVTVGGAIAADVHGKNHHVDGSFGNHVSEFDILLASGDIVTAAPDGDNAELFWATVGGMGLTGVVLEATIQLKEVETSYFVVDTDRTANLSQMLTALETGDDDYTYSVAWFDTATTGDSLGRGVIMRGNTASREALDPDQRRAALEFAAPQRGRVPFELPVGLVNRFSAKAFNALWYAKSPRHRTDEIQDITQFFHPLDIVGDWNRVYGPKGFCQYQFVVPFGEEAAFTTIVETIAQSDHVSSLNVLKRFGPGNRAPLSFPISGWTLAVDLPVRAGLDALLNHLDQLVLAAGGRIYLAKDSRISAATFAQMYPRLDEFRASRARFDPTHTFRSDLSRRLDL
ncbi:decaprenylphospho-beta-D-ribofuranose 2-oxidase [Aeromicrobium panaciterrae]|uniref:Decaprenylphospho-beta-D-ribofuranose 2-oxidase n=1 Tax=Aeromicrobium panaciterrae TaxID=363861 RepID=A0ABU1UPK6_9ACTN|nr:FAD-binding oxidoreductase [Aeromicrobium panaciterrae]MDR7087094.1 decaprenylphospho-beta-D-ribofuranose 2-oxidase [Aeromicrobium panaciterrae]